MKTLKFILPAFFLLPISLVFAVFAQQDVTGTYVWVGAGCRDSILSESSHESRPKKHPKGLESLFRITDIKFTLNRDGSVVTTVEGDDGKKNGETYKTQDTGTYTVYNYEVSIRSTNQKGGLSFFLYIAGDYLVYDFKRAGVGDDDFHATMCGPNKVFVFVFGNIN